MRDATRRIVEAAYAVGSNPAIFAITTDSFGTNQRVAGASFGGPAGPGAGTIVV